jgi:tetratricopeptide (TPR) repeat protein
VNDIDAACQCAGHLADVGRYAAAEKLVRTALGQAPEDAELLTTLGYLLRMQERYLDALAACDAAVAVAPDWGAAHAQRAWILRSGPAGPAAGRPAPRAGPGAVGGGPRRRSAGNGA